MSSCSEISSQLAALSAEIAALNGRFASKAELNQLENNLNNKFIPKVEKPQIIQSSVAQAEALILPAIGYAITQRLAPILSKINILDDLIKALGVAVSKLNPLLQLLGNIGILLQLATSAAALLALASRMDILERAVNFAAQYASDAYALAGVARKMAQDATASVSQALQESSIAIALARSLEKKFDNLQAFVSNLSSDLKALTARVSKLEYVVDALQKYIQGIVIEFFSRFVEALGELAARLEYVAGQASAALTIGKEAKSEAKIAVYQVGEVRALVSGLSGKVATLEGAIGEIPELKRKVTGLEGIIGGIQGKIRSLEGDISGLKARIENILSSIPATVTNVVNAVAPPIVQTITPPIVNNLISPAVNGLIPNIINYVTNNVTNIFNGMNNLDLSRLENKIDAIPSAMIAAYIASPAVFTRSVAAAATGTCQTMQPGGCGDNAMKRNNNELFGKVSGLFNSGANAAQLALLNVINTKLGNQITNAAGNAIGIGGALLRVGNNMLTDRVLNLIATAASIHNALMLSNSIGTTLAATIDTVVGLFGVKDGNGEAFSISSVLGKSVKTWLEGVIGANNVSTLTTTFAKANRIYQGATNLYSSVRQLFDSSFQLAETTAENTGKIGNALRDNGVVAFNAYNQMSERYQGIRDKKFVRMAESLEKIDSTASSLSMITSDIKDVADEIGEVQEQRLAFKKALQELEPEKKPIINKPVLEREKQQDKDSEPPTIKEGDESGE